MPLRKGSLLIFFASLTIKAQSPPPLPTWQDEIAKNFMPYHQLTTTDFSINDKVHRDTSCWVSPSFFITITSWKNRRGAVLFTLMSRIGRSFPVSTRTRLSDEVERGISKRNCPTLRRSLDLNEIWARQMAALALGEFPGGRGDNFAAARDDLDARVKAFCRERCKPLEIELEAFVKETKRGENKEKVRGLSAAIRKRLDAIPLTPAASAVPAINTPPSPTSAPHALTVL